MSIHNFFCGEIRKNNTFWLKNLNKSYNDQSGCQFIFNQNVLIFFIFWHRNVCCGLLIQVTQGRQFY